jgi:DNA topoisomerase-3
MTKRVYLCEKPSVGKALASALGWSGGQKGSYVENGNQIITWAFGHLISQAPPERYLDTDNKSWDYLWRNNYLPIFPKEWVMEAPDPEKAYNDVEKKNQKGRLDQLNRIGVFLGRADEVVIATDLDREGETIAVEILEFFKFSGKRMRMKFRSLDNKSLKTSHDEMVDAAETFNFYLAGLGRMRADWLMGMNLTMSITAQNESKLPPKEFLSVGRVQTPLVHLVTMRDSEIKNFKPVDHFSVSANFIAEGGAYKGKLEFDKSELDEEGLYLSQQGIDRILSDLSGQPATITKFDVNRKKTSCPIGYSLDELQIECVNKFGYTIKQVLDLAQKLYEAKIISYPRTDSGHMENAQFKDAPSIVKTVASNVSGAYDTLLGDIDYSRKSAMWNDSKVGAHHAIIPIDNTCNFSALSKDEKNVYDLVCRRYLMQFMPTYEYSSTKVGTRVGERTFSSSGNVPLIIGWKAALRGNIDTDDEDTLPKMSIGDSVKVDRIKKEAKKTTPPSHYNEATLLKDMVNVAKFIENPKLRKIIKKGGIGTNATRANIIETCMNRRYLERKGKKILATEKAFAIDEVAPSELKLPETTAYWEEALNAVVDGTMTLEKFMKQQDNILGKIAEKIRSGECDLKKEVKGSGKAYRCDKCKAYLSRVKGKKSKKFFWMCSDRDECGAMYEDSRGKPGAAFQTIEQPKGDHPCPTCKETMLYRKSKKTEKMFWVCSDKKCDTFCGDNDGQIGEKFGSSSKQTSEHQCPTCTDGRMLQRNGAKGAFWGCNKYPKCKSTLQDDNGLPARG